jgi:hypothetical protein
VIEQHVPQAAWLIDEFNVEPSFEVGTFPCLVEVGLVTGPVKLGRVTIQRVVLILLKLPRRVIQGKLTDLAAFTHRALPPSISQYFRPF